jgi:hypothetical protein
MESEKGSGRGILLEEGMGKGGDGEIERNVQRQAEGKLKRGGFRNKKERTVG